MSAHATVWAWNQKAGKAKTVLVALANFADSRGVCRVPQTHLAAMTEGCVKTVQRHLQQLEERGLIERLKHWDDEGRQELDEIQLCGLTARRTAEKRRVSGGDNLSPYRENPGDNLSPIEQDPYSLLVSTFPTNNDATSPSGLPIPANLEAGGDAGPEIGAEAPLVSSGNDQAPDGAAPGGAQVTSPSPEQSDNAHHHGENVNAEGSEQVPAAAGRSPYRAAMDAISAAGLLPVWRDWVRLNRLAQVTQEAQAPVWAGWIAAGQTETLRHNAMDLIQSGSFSHPWGALRKRMTTAQPATQAASAPSRPTFTAGQRVRYPDGSVATVLAVLSRGIATDHPEYPDVPLAQIRALQVVE